MAGLLGAISGLGDKGPFNKLFEKLVPDTKSILDNKTSLEIQNLINQGKKDQIKDQGGNDRSLQDLKNKGLKDLAGIDSLTKNQILDKQQQFQKDFRDQGIKAFKDAGLPDFSYYAGNGSLNLGQTSDSIGGNASVRSLGQNLRLPKTGSSNWADLNGLSRPDTSALGKFM